MKKDKDKRGHILFIGQDFTIEELERRNIIAVNVVENGMKICKHCGATDDELNKWCPAATYSCPRLTDMAAFMKARHDIYLQRKQGIRGPWTDDPILRRGRFCNIYRELDRVTIWIDKHIRKPYADHPYLWFMLCIARYINWPDTLEELLDTRAWPESESWKPEYLTYALENRAAREEKIYTGAYMIRAESSPKVEWFHWTKHRYIAEIVLGRLWEDREDWVRFFDHEPVPEDYGKFYPSLEQTWDKFQQSRYIGWGPFMAYEVVTDLRHTRYLRKAPDIFTWANAGPGAIRGLNRAYNQPLTKQPPKEQLCQEMQVIMAELNHYDGKGFSDTFGKPNKDNPRFEMRDIEHMLCEFDKYERVRLGEGRMRAKYYWEDAGPI